MKCLHRVRPTPEQIQIVSRTKPGIEVIRGAAGSGKTTTALLRLKSLIGLFFSRRKRENSLLPIKILILTYNRTLKSYVEELVDNEIGRMEQLELQVSTFAKWGMGLTGINSVVSNRVRKQIIDDFSQVIDLPEGFLIGEVEYILGRFTNYEDYITANREGRGGIPKVDHLLRRKILDEVLYPYLRKLEELNVIDWSQLALEVASADTQKYDVVICDEVQDFTANQIRAVKHHMADISSLTFVLDSAQRIYARGFTWKEIGIDVRPENSFRLITNYRNPKPVALLASSLLQGVPQDDDSTMPNLDKCSRKGSQPILIKAELNEQIDFSLEFITKNVDLKTESVAFLHPKGYSCFDPFIQKLNAKRIGFKDITRKADWPKGGENVALSTIHSSKGLEFDYIFLLDLDQDNFNDWEDMEDQRCIELRKLLAMGISRARVNVVLGCSKSNAVDILDIVPPALYTQLEAL